MIQVRVAQQSAVSVRIAGAAPVRVDVTGTAVVSAPEYSGPYDITPLFTAQVLPTAKKLIDLYAACGDRFNPGWCKDWQQYYGEQRYDQP